MVDELNDGAEGQRVREAVLPIPMEYLNELVVASFPVSVKQKEEAMKPVELPAKNKTEKKVKVKAGRSLPESQSVVSVHLC